MRLLPRSNLFAPGNWGRVILTCKRRGHMLHANERVRAQSKQIFPLPGAFPSSLCRLPPTQRVPQPPLPPGVQAVLVLLGLQEGLPPALCALCCSQVLTLENWLLGTGSNFLMLFNTRYCIPIVKGPHPVLIQDLDIGSLWCYKHRFKSLTMY